MGLDMYLTADEYMWTRDRQSFKATFDFPVEQITYEVCYWRKANAIHKWFVDNVQQGKDDCDKYEVSEKQLRDLLKTVKAVLADPSRAAELLPPCSGFFFGSTEIDNSYMYDLRATEEALRKIPPDMMEKVRFHYQASW